MARPHGSPTSRPAAWWLSRPERLRYGLQLVGVLRHVVLGVCIILADYSLFWLLDLIRNQLQGEIVARGEHRPRGLRGAGRRVAPTPNASSPQRRW